MQKRAVIISGPLTDEDIKMLCWAARCVEQNNRDEVFTLEICENEMSLEAARELLRKTYPQLPEQTVYEGVIEEGKVKNTGEYK